MPKYFYLFWEALRIYMDISLREVTKDNWLDIIHLEITKEQEIKVKQ